MRGSKGPAVLFEGGSAWIGLTASQSCSCSCLVRSRWRVNGGDGTVNDSCGVVACGGLNLWWAAVECGGGVIGEWR